MQHEIKEVFKIDQNKILLSDELHDINLYQKTIMFLNYLIDSWSLNSFKGSENVIKLPELKYIKIEEKIILYIDTKLNIRDFSNSLIHVKYHKNIPYLSYDLLRSTFGKPTEFIIYNLFYLSFNSTTEDLVKYLKHVLNVLHNINKSNSYIKNNYENQLYYIFNNQSKINLNIYDIDYKITEKYEHINNIIPYELQDIYIQKFGTDYTLYGFNTQIKNKDYFVRRICIKLYQNSILSNSAKIANCLTKLNSEKYNELINAAYNRSISVLSNFYPVNIKSEIILENLSFDFFVDYKNLSNDFEFDKMFKSKKTKKTEKNVFQFVKTFIEAVMKTDNIRTKLMILHTFLRLVCYTAIRKSFIIFYVNETPSITTENKNELFIKYNLEIFSNLNFPTNEDVKSYCSKNNLFYDLLLKRYKIFKDLILIKQYDINTKDPLIYLTNVLDDNIKMTFLLYMFSEFKFDTSKKIQTLYKKTNVCFDSNYVNSPIDEYDNVNRCYNTNNKVIFNDRGIDWIRSNPIEFGNVYLEAFKNGESMLTGHSGHSADILLGIAYLYGDYENKSEFPILIKHFLLMCIVVMFPRKDHSIYEMYYSMTQFNIFDKFKFWDNQMPFLTWLLENICDSEEYSYYLTPQFAEIVENIINIVKNNSNILQVVIKCKNVISDKNLLFILFNIMVKEELLKKLNDSEYAYYSAELNNTIKIFSNFKNSKFPNSLTYEDFDTYEDQNMKCNIIKEYNYKHYFYKGSSFINILIILRSYFSNFYCE